MRVIFNDWEVRKLEKWYWSYWKFKINACWKNEKVSERKPRPQRFKRERNQITFISN